MIAGPRGRRLALMPPASASRTNKTAAVLWRLCADAGARDADGLAHRLELLIEGALVVRLLKGDEGRPLGTRDGADAAGGA